MKAAVLFVFSLMCCIPGAAFAQPLKVISGEHEDFTRIVTPLAGGTDWTVKQTDRKIIVTLNNYNNGFETNSVFDLIPRKRIEQLTSNTNQLTLTLGCDCNAATFVTADRYLVIDIASQDVTLAGDLVQKQPAEKPIEQLLTDEPLGVEIKALPPPAAVVLPLISETRRTASTTLNFPQRALDRTQLPDEQRQILADMQEQLARQLGSAATRGVLTPVPGRNLPAVPNLKKPDPLPTERLPETADSALGQLANLRISSSLDRADRTRNDGFEVAGLSCPPSGAFDLSAWGTTDPFSEQLAQARNGLYGELDRLDHTVATQLAQLYLYFGFGAEARQILKLDPALAESKSSLLFIADLLDGLAPSNAISLSRNPDCEPDVVLWATLAQPEPVKGAKPDADAALRALTKLPVHLRQILAPVLSNKLLAYGDARSAAQALRSLERQPDPVLAAGKLAQAELDLHIGAIQRGTAQLEEVAGANTEQSPAALIALIDAKIAEHQPISIEAAQLTAAYAHELKTSELGPELRRVHILSLLKTGQFDEAFEASQALGGNEDTVASKKLRGYLLRELTSSADDIVFLEHIFAQRETDIASLSARDQSALAERFLTIGFAERAEETLEYIPEQTRHIDQKILAAKIALALGKPHKAQTTLSGIEDISAQMLRADAKRMIGDDGEAHELYLQTNQSQTAAEVAWLSEDWQNLTSGDTPVFGAASRLAGSLDAPSEDSLGMLARSAAALDESAAARQALADLLAADELQLSPEN